MGSVGRATEANKKLLIKADALLRDLFGDALVPGFHGRIAIEAVIHDGSIQYVQGLKEQKHKVEETPA
jgi:hypothetical protein